MPGKKRKVGQLMLGQVLLTIAILLVICRSCFLEWDSLIRSFFFSFILCIALGEGNRLLVGIIDRKISWIETPVKRLIVGLLILVSYSFAVSLFFVLLFHLFIFRIVALQDITWLYILAATTVPVYIAIILMVIATSWSFLMAWRQAAIDAEKLKRENLQAQYDALKNQVNPHFLFNSFNVLTDLVYVNQNLAARFIQQLSQVFRYVLESSRKEVVPLKTELQFLSSYVFLLDMRFGDHLKVILPEQADTGAQIVPLCLQMLVENAIKHNIVSSDDPLTIRISIEGERVRVSNNLQRRNTVEHSMGLGLANIQARYEHLNGKSVQVEEAAQCFSVSVPLIAAQP